MASSHFQGSPLRDSSLANGACPVPGLQVVQVRFPQPETWGSGPGEVRLYRIEHGANVMALEPDAVKRRAFPPSPPGCESSLKVASPGPRRTKIRGWDVSQHPPRGSGPLHPKGASVFPPDFESFHGPALTASTKGECRHGLCPLHGQSVQPCLL